MRLIRPEDASPALRGLYEDIRTGLGTAFVPDIILALGEHPHYLEEMWSALGPIAASAEFEEECEHVRRTAQEAVGHLPLPMAQGIVGILASPLDSAIPDELDAVAFADSRAAVVSALLHASLRGEGAGMYTTLTPALSDSPPHHLRLIDEENATDRVRVLCCSIEKALGGSFLPSGYRTLAKWPHFLEAGWRHIKSIAGGSAYDFAREQVLEAAFYGARPFFSAGLLGADSIRRAAIPRDEEDEIRAHARFFARFEPGLIVQMFLLAEIAESIIGIERERLEREAERDRERFEAA